MRIVTRPDFDGLVCAVLLIEAEGVDGPIKWVEPSEIQNGQVAIGPTDILANLPYQAPAAMWFDHHVSNSLADRQVPGLFRIAPSAAGLVYEHYRNRFARDFRELVAQADKIDAADLSPEEVRRPEDHPYILLSMTVSGRDPADEPYWNHLVSLLRRLDIDAVMADSRVAAKCRTVEAQNREFRNQLLAHTRVEGQVAISDFRNVEAPVEGNRFLVYSLFPETVVSVRIRRDERQKGRIGVSVGHSIFNRGCRVNAGLMLANFGGGGHRGAGACRFDEDLADDYIPKILEILKKNEPNE